MTGKHAPRFSQRDWRRIISGLDELAKTFEADGHELSEDVLEFLRAELADTRAKVEARLRPRPR